jgi:hypothetical protein
MEWLIFATCFAVICWLWHVEHRLSDFERDMLVTTETDIKFDMEMKAHKDLTFHLLERFGAAERRLRLLEQGDEHLIGDDDASLKPL